MQSSWPKPPKARLAKRLADMFVASACLVFFMPMLLVIALTVKLDGGPIFYGHRRINSEGRPFRCWKFRCMVANADEILDDLVARDPGACEEWEQKHKLRNTPCVTPIGALLRETGLDAFPQLWNVLVGDMSLVGPQPIVEAEIERHGQRMAAYWSCRPGITGLWRVSGRSSLDYSTRIKLDEAYARNWSMWLDFTILLKTIVVDIKKPHGY